MSEYVIELGRSAGYYQNVNRRPQWVDRVADAKVFTDLKTAKVVLRALERVPAKVVQRDVALATEKARDAVVRARVLREKQAGEQD